MWHADSAGSQDYCRGNWDCGRPCGEAKDEGISLCQLGSGDDRDVLLGRGVHLHTKEQFMLQSPKQSELEGVADGLLPTLPKTSSGSVSGTCATFNNTVSWSHLLLAGWNPSGPQNSGCLGPLKVNSMG